MLPTFPPSGLPVFGIGTYELRGDACVRAVCHALRLGVRLVDTAAVYRNEELVGQGIAASGVPRASLFIVVKVAMKTMKSEADVRAGILRSLDKLQMDYADCVVIHWPGCGGVRPDEAATHAAARARCWRVMCALRAEGKARWLGVSNFQPRHFDALRTATSRGEGAGVLLNQIELHPLCLQDEVVQYCRTHHILLQQYSPLGKGDARLVRHPELCRLQQTHFAAYSISDMLLMWGLSQGYCTLVRSEVEAHVEANVRIAHHFFRRTEVDAPAQGETRPLLTDTQRDLLHRLHEVVHHGPDVHLCWDGDTIA